MKTLTKLVLASVISVVVAGVAIAGKHYDRGFKCKNGWVMTSPKYCPEHKINQ